MADAAAAANAPVRFLAASSRTASEPSTFSCSCGLLFIACRINRTWNIARGSAWQTAQRIRVKVRVGYRSSLFDSVTQAQSESSESG